MAQKINNNKKIKKIVIPAAGFGTRMLPQTKAMPKEMMPVVDKPVIQYIVEEAVEAGIEDVILVTGYHKRSIEDHFDYTHELEQRLADAGKHEELEKVKEIAEMANFIYIRQKGDGYGNALPVISAKHLLENEPFALLWGDIIAESSRLKVAVEAYEKYEAPIMCGQNVTTPGAGDKYGFIKGDKVEPGIWRVEDFVEKPGDDNKPSDIAVMNGYILTPDILPLLDNLKPDKSGEFCLIDAIKELTAKRDVYTVDIGDIKQYDTGNKLEYLKTVTDFALSNGDVSEDYRRYLETVLN